MALYWTGSQRIETGRLRSKVDEYSPCGRYLYRCTSTLPSKTPPAHTHLPLARPQGRKSWLNIPCALEIWSTSSSKSIDRPLVERRKSPCFPISSCSPRTNQCFRLNWLLMTVKIFQHRRILSVVGRFKTTYHISVSSCKHSHTRKKSWLTNHIIE